MRPARVIGSTLTMLMVAWGGDSFASPAESAPVAAAPAPVASLKFRLRNGLILLPVTVNGSEPLSFLLDSGYSITTIQPQLAESLNLRRAGRVTIVGIAGEEEAPMFAGAEFRLGDAVYAPRRVAAVPSEAQRRRRRDGILGAGLFQRYVVQLDFPAGAARLFEPSSYVYDGGGKPVPLGFSGEIPTVAGTIPLPDGTFAEGRFKVDTGCDDGVCLGHEFIAANKLDTLLAGAGHDIKRGVGGEAQVTSGRLPSLRLGDYEAKKVSASFFPDDSPAGRGVVGHIGMGTLRQFAVTFDFQRQRLFLEPTGVR